MNNWRTVSPYMTEDEAWNELADLEMLGIHYNLEERMDYREHKAKLMKDPEFRKAYEAPEIERDIEEAVKAVRDTRLLLNEMVEGWAEDNQPNIDMDDYEYDPVAKVHFLKPEKRKMIEEYANYAKQEIRFCPYCGAALGIGG